MLLLSVLVFIINLVQCQPSRRAVCTDTMGWRDKDELGCYFYQIKKICISNGFGQSLRFYSGNTYNFPELNCCACGKKNQLIYNQYPESTKLPSSLPNTCTHLEVNNKSQHIRKYCTEATTFDECNSLGPKWRSLHCRWNPKIDIFN